MGCNVHRAHLRVADVSHRLLENPPLSLQPHLSKCRKHVVSPHELNFLSKLFRDLASRSGGETVDKRTFLQFFPLPVSFTQGLWGERLFQKFDKLSLNSIGFAEFIEGLSICARGSDEEKLHFLFALYDLRGDGFLDKEELVSMVHNTYKRTLRRNSSCEFEISEESKSLLSPSQTITTRTTSTTGRKEEQKSSAALIKRDEFGTQEQVDTFVGKIIAESSAGDKLDFKQFAEFVHSYPKIMEVFIRTFREEIWSVENTKEVMGSLRNFRSRKCGCLPLKSRSARIVTTGTSTMGISHLEKSGWMHAQLRHNQESPRKVFVTLKGNMLLVYASPGTALPSSVIFLEGCYIEPLKDQGGKQGFAITHQFESFEEVTFWCSLKADLDDWLPKLVQAAKTRNIEEKYTMKERVGAGKFSVVYMAEELATNLHWAIKVVQKEKLTEQEREMLRSEIAIMRLLNHPNVVQMKEVYEDKNNMYLVMELVEGGELFDRIQSKRVFSEFTSFYIAKQLLETVKYLHEVGIVHRDIKPENILLSDESEIPTIKLADFGLSKLVGPNDTLTVACGTLSYVAPEVLLQHPYGKPVDIWSIGIVTYLMLRGRLPFDSRDKQLLIQKTIDARLDLNPEYWNKYTPYVTDFLRKLITKNAEERLTADQALDHQWIKNGEILIPRTINREEMDEDSMKKTIASARMIDSINSGYAKSVTSVDSVSHMIYSIPELCGDVGPPRRFSEKSLAINLLDS